MSVPDPIRITDTDVLEFMALYKKQFGEDISFQDARDQATKLVRLMQIVYQPITVEEYEAVKELDKPTG